MPLPISNSRHVAVAEGGLTRVVAVADLAASLGVDALIRLHEEDFSGLAQIGRDLVHFNLERTINRVGLRYALLPILRPGFRRSGGPEELPVLDPTRFRTGLCVEVRQRVPVTAVTPESFGASLPAIRDAGALSAALVRRYAGLFPDLDPSGLVARGCAITRLRLQER
ncbi:hypothetical protein [Methylobacterium frigidaeris]|uniref:Uncharacterized protein n=1 Tax=Methylobacterium frigidaeris TaxID=2038277 RepID=A0AA37HA79_9HYPH|nr:hypothetical protein [Methylobacterium frigidaeris]PIK74409.1 hypothetical protein CS379_02670 [Methylobacterium frigidaeris]GJD61620.1 hypothetical protein MPEAHAMD_1763 [Methylobacterium frigidaeris]